MGVSYRSLLVVLLLLVGVSAALAQHPLPFTPLAACDPFLDSDGDGFLDCDDQCPGDPDKTSPGDCGCNLLDLDLNSDGILECAAPCPVDSNLPDGGICTCPLVELIFRLVLNLPSPCTNLPPLTKRTVITDPPSVIVVQEPNGTSSLQIFFQRFGGALSTLRQASRAANQTARAVRIKNVKLKVRYDVQITDESIGKVVAKRSVKRNQLTIRNLKAGSYSVRYRAAGIKDDKAVFKSGFSPSQGFTIP